MRSAGESLQDERVHGGAFVAMDGVQMPYKHMPVLCPSSPCATGFSSVCNLSKVYGKQFVLVVPLTIP